SDIASITFADGSRLRTIDQWAFGGMRGTESIEIPAGVTFIGNNAFNSWTAQQTIRIPFASIAEASANWGSGWRTGNNAVVKNVQGNIVTD
ncbi:MAG: leucine-rich repeat domain-containing protein, partial [Treponema sp.]|nr:leucine-rich repeat domain-containing protein [Treponema sp.]